MQVNLIAPRSQQQRQRVGGKSIGQLVGA